MKKIILIILIFAVTALADLVVVVPKSFPIDKIDLNTLKKLYRLEKTNISGKKVKLFAQKNETEYEKFFEALGINDKALKKIWLKKKLTGGGQVPDMVSDDVEMLISIKDSEAGIGIVKESSVTDDVKVLLKL